MEVSLILARSSCDVVVRRVYKGMEKGSGRVEGLVPSGRGLRDVFGWGRVGQGTGGAPCRGPSTRTTTFTDNQLRRYAASGPWGKEAYGGKTSDSSEVLGSKGLMRWSIFDFLPSQSTYPRPTGEKRRRKALRVEFTCRVHSTGYRISFRSMSSPKRMREAYKA